MGPPPQQEEQQQQQPEEGIPAVEDNPEEDEDPGLEYSLDRHNGEE